MSTLGRSLVVFLCLVAAMAAAGARPAEAERVTARAGVARTGPRAAENPSRRTVYLENPHLSVGPARLDVRLGAALQIPHGWTQEEAARRHADPDPYWLVKFSGPVGRRERERLEAGGSPVLAYYPYNAFLVRLGPGASPDGLAALADVAWVGRFHPFFKIDHELAALVTGAAPLEKDAEGGGHRLVVGLHDERRRAAVEPRIAALPGVIELLPTRGPLRVQVAADDVVETLRAIAALPDVAFVERIHPAELSNDENVQTSQSGLCNAFGPEDPNTPIFARGVNGWNVRVVVADTCLDANEGWFYDDALARLAAHETAEPWNAVPPDWEQRKLIEYYDMFSGDTTIGCAGATGCGGACPNHGTHVSGTATGNCSLDQEGIATPTDAANDDGDNDGMAPGARLIAQDLGNGTLSYLGADGGDLGELIAVAHANTCLLDDCGIDLHNNSWNISTTGYETNARGADAQLWALKRPAVVVSAGNAGTAGFGTVRAPATGKNVIGVGSAIACGAQSMVAASGRGPTQDGRLKPDIVTNGDAVTSAFNDGDGSTVANGGCVTQVLNGTSMAAGTATGLGALAVQYFRDGFYPGGAANQADALDPSGMLVKALLVNSARRMTGSGAETSGVGWPNMDQGWGFVVLDDALYFAGDQRRLWVHDEPAGLDVSGTQSLSFQRKVTGSSQPLKVTLVWYDKQYPALCGFTTPCLLNDLDLTVTDENTGIQYSVTRIPGASGQLVPRTVVPVNPQAGQTTSNNGPDATNTVEQIIVYAPTAPGNFTFTVTAANTPDGPIPFALVATGAIAEPCPAISAPPNNTAIDVSACGDTGVEIAWSADPPDWGDGGAGGRYYEVLRDGAPILAGGCGGALAYGTSSCIDDTAANRLEANYTVRYHSGCGAVVTTAGEPASDELGPIVDVMPDGSSTVCPGASVQLSVGVAPPSGSYLYQWTENGGELAGETGSTLSVTRAGEGAAQYNCRVTDLATGCEVADVYSSMAVWTTEGFADVDYDASFNPAATMVQSCGDGDAVVEAGEVWQVTPRLKNFGPCGVATNVRADLTPAAGSQAPLLVCGGATAHYGSIAAGATATRPYLIDVDAGATCGAGATLDVTNVWWSGGGGGAQQPAFGFQVGVPVGMTQTATQFTDPLEISTSTAFSALTPATTWPSAFQAEFDYVLSCHPGPLEPILLWTFTNLTGWTVTGNVTSSSANPDTCPSGGGNNAYFNGNGTLTRAISTAGRNGIRVEADFRGGAAYTLPTQCFKWWYSVDGGSNWILYKDVCGAAIPNGTWACVQSFNFPPTADNNPSFRLRFETTGGVDIRLDALALLGRDPPCAVQGDVEVELVGPGGLLTVKAPGAPDPPKPINVTSFYNGPQGGPGQWFVALTEDAGGTARISGAKLKLFDTGPECDVSPSCACPAAPPGEVSDDPPHFLRVAKGASGVDLLVEDLAAQRYNVYVSTAGATLPFAVGSPAGKKDCDVATAGAAGGMRRIPSYDVESGIGTPSAVHFILVTADNGSPHEGGSGYTSSGTARTATSYCAK